MNLGYAAIKQKNYQTALVNFKRALAFDLGNKYAVEAIGNVSRYIQQTRNWYKPCAISFVTRPID